MILCLYLARFIGLTFLDLHCIIYSICLIHRTLGSGSVHRFRCDSGANFCLTSNLDQTQKRTGPFWNCTAAHQPCGNRLYWEPVTFTCHANWMCFKSIQFAYIWTNLNAISFLSPLPCLSSLICGTIFRSIMWVQGQWQMCAAYTLTRLSFCLIIPFKPLPLLCTSQPSPLFAMACYVSHRTCFVAPSQDALGPTDAYILSHCFDFL